MRSCSGLYENSMPHQVSNVGIVEAELDEDLARVLAELRHAAPDAAAARTVGPHRKHREAARHGMPLLELRIALRLARRDAEVYGDVVLFEQTDPFIRF